MHLCTCASIHCGVQPDSPWRHGHALLPHYKTQRRPSKQWRSVPLVCSPTKNQPMVVSCACPPRLPTFLWAHTASFPRPQTLTPSSHIHWHQSPWFFCFRFLLGGFTCTLRVPPFVYSKQGRNTILNFSTTCGQVAERLLAAWDGPVWSLACMLLNQICSSVVSGNVWWHFQSPQLVGQVSSLFV